MASNMNWKKWVYLGYTGLAMPMHTKLKCASGHAKVQPLIRKQCAAFEIPECH